MAIVLDASAALSFLAASQTTTASEAFRKSLGDAPLIAPFVCAWEVRHALLKLERRGLIPPETLDLDLIELERLIVIAPPPGHDGGAALVTLARAEKLGLYDAAYLHLAIESGAALASRVGLLLEAAHRRGITLHDLR